LASAESLRWPRQSSGSRMRRSKRDMPPVCDPRVPKLPDFRNHFRKWFRK
jgi:hypothetical protein